jgi:hypothetical protein
MSTSTLPLSTSELLQVPEHPQHFPERIKTFSLMHGLIDTVSLPKFNKYNYHIIVPDQGDNRSHKRYVTDIVFCH